MHLSGWERPPVNGPAARHGLKQTLPAISRPKLASVTTYNGPAVLLTEEEAEIPVTARLTSYRDELRTSWRGSLTPTADGLQQVLNLFKGRLRLPDGTEAEFLRPDTSDWVSTKQLTILGQDEPPF
jgi:hypothetical protein